MSQRFHVTPKGQVRQCKAVGGGCPYGAEDHADSREAAEKRRDEKMRVEHGSGLSGVRKGSDTTSLRFRGVGMSQALVQQEIDRSFFNGDKPDLSGADLRNMDLSFFDLHNADLSGADLRGANLSGADLRWLRYDSSTRIDETTIVDEETLWDESNGKSVIGVEGLKKMLSGSL